MSKSLFFWLLFIVFVILYLTAQWDTLTWRGSLFAAEVAVLIGVLGWGVFGKPVN